MNRHQSLKKTSRQKAAWAWLNLYAWSYASILSFFIVKFVDQSQDRMESLQDVAVLLVCVNFTNISCICLFSEEVMTIFCTKMARFGSGAS
jgi:hypothetical protein